MASAHRTRRPSCELRRLLALALDALLRRDPRNGGFVMAAGTIPDHVGLRNPLLARLGLQLGPGKLGLGEVVPAGQVQSLERALECRPPMLFRPQHRPDHFELLIAEPDDPHVASSGSSGLLWISGTLEP